AKSIFKIVEDNAIKNIPIARLMENMRSISGDNMVMHCWCELRLKCQTTHVLNSIAAHKEWNLGVTMLDCYLVDITHVQGPTSGASTSTTTHTDDDFFLASAGLTDLIQRLTV
ncbi:hypothetical protein CPC16_005475, partial [Podila verticillata]